MEQCRGVMIVLVLGTALVASTARANAADELKRSVEREAMVSHLGVPRITIAKGELRVRCTGSMVHLLWLVDWRNGNKLRLRRATFDISREPRGIEIPATLAFSIAAKSETAASVPGKLLDNAYAAGLRVTRFEAEPVGSRQLNLRIDAQGPLAAEMRLRLAMRATCAKQRLQCGLQLNVRPIKRFPVTRLSTTGGKKARVELRGVGPIRALHFLDPKRGWVAAPPTQAGKRVSGVLDPLKPLVVTARALGLSARRVRRLVVLTTPGASFGRPSPLARKRGRRVDLQYAFVRLAYLASVLGEITAHTVVSTPELSDRRVSAWAHNLPAFEVLDALVRAGNLRTRLRGKTVVLSSKPLQPLDRCPEALRKERCRAPETRWDSKRVDLRAKAAPLGQLLALLHPMKRSPRICGSPRSVSLILNKVRRGSAVDLLLRAAGAVRMHEEGGDVSVRDNSATPNAAGCRSPVFSQTRKLGKTARTAAVQVVGKVRRALMITGEQALIVEEGTALSLDGEPITVAEVKQDAVFLRKANKPRIRIPLADYQVGSSSGERARTLITHCQSVLVAGCPLTHVELLGTLTGVRHPRALIGCWGTRSANVYRAKYVTRAELRVRRILRDRVVLDHRRGTQVLTFSKP
jgi:hypothetical protein